MIALGIKSTKSIMSALLMSEAFDKFNVEDITITTFNTFSIDGHINKDFYNSEEIEAMENGLPVFSSWKEIRPVCFELIKGKKTPVSFKFVLQANSELVSLLAKDPASNLSSDMIKGLVLNIKYENGKVTLITGCSYNSFVMDKSMDMLWDRYVPRLLNELKIDFDEI